MMIVDILSLAVTTYSHKIQALSDLLPEASHGWSGGCVCREDGRHEPGHVDDLLNPVCGWWTSFTGWSVYGGGVDEVYHPWC